MKAEVNGPVASELTRRGGLPESIPVPLTSEFRLFCVALAGRKPTDSELVWVWNMFTWRAERLIISRQRARLSVVRGTDDMEAETEAMKLLWKGWSEHYHGPAHFDEACMVAWQHCAYGTKLSEVKR